MTTPQVHTVWRDGAWRNEITGITRYEYDSKEDAVKAARSLAKRLQAEHFIHNQDGTIGEKNSYGDDPYPPRG